MSDLFKFLNNRNPTIGILALVFISLIGFQMTILSDGFADAPTKKGDSNQFQKAQNDKSKTSAKKTNKLNKKMYKGPKVNINKADAKTLQKNLKGVGKVKAKAIIDFRKKNGSFKKLSDLTRVKGISQKILENNRGLLEM